MDKGLMDKVAIITGCSGGIGKDIAIRFAREGAKLAICARSTQKLEATKAICEQEGVPVLALTCDVTKPEDLENLVNETVKRFGTVDILVNNAINAKPGSPFLDQTEEDVMAVFESGYLATWRLMKLCFPYMKEHGGKIINFGSASGISGTAGYSAYGSMKEAIRALTRTVAREWGKYGINVNCICPTAITENMQKIIDSFPEGKRTPESLGFTIPPIGRVGTAYDDVTPVVVFLASEGSGYLTGQTIRADGGSTMFAL